MHILLYKNNIVRPTIAVAGQDSNIMLLNIHCCPQNWNSFVFRQIPVFNSHLWTPVINFRQFDQ